MHEHPDEDLNLLFDRARTPLASELFLRELETRLNAVRRSLRLLRIGTLALAAVLAASIALILSPYIAELCLALGSAAQSAAPPLGAVLASPAGWVVSILIAMLVLRRSGVFGR